MTLQASTSAIHAFVAQIRDELGESAISLAEETLTRYGEHTLPAADVAPIAVAYPASTQDVRKLVLAANRHKVPLFPISAGQNIGLGSRAAVLPGQVIVDLGRNMQRILEVNETLGYCVIEPGVSFQALHDELKKRGDKLMMSPTAGPPQGSVIGNAMDKGGGYGPAADHFGAICGMEIVLGNGEIIRTGDGSLDSPEQLNWHVSKYSFGPTLDGLFAQSNYGIVTRVGMWLMPRPPHIASFFFSFPDDDDLGEIIDLIRPLKLSNFVPVMMRATNDLYLSAAEEKHPEYAATQGRKALSDAARKTLQRQHGIGAWTVSGALYGASAQAVQPQIDRLRKHFTQSGKGRYIDPAQAEDMAPLDISRDNYAGAPGEGELGMLRWRPGGGAVWFTPGLPMVGSVANEFRRLSEDICRDHGLEYMVSNVCGARFARGVHVILFNRTDPDESARADACYRALSDMFSRRGVFVGRAPTAYQPFHQQRRMPAFNAACSAIKQALDPNDIIAPGKYGIE
ncbi:MAG TPA: FAD-binding oxidoreductase [Bordetella sp.]